MTNGEIVVSGEALNPILISFFYIVALGLARARLLPQLSPSVAPIAIGLMLAQIAVIAISTFYAPASSYEAWLWHLDREFNIPSTSRIRAAGDVWRGRAVGGMVGEGGARLAATLPGRHRRDFPLLGD